MKNMKNNPFIIDGFKVEGFCNKTHDAFFVRFSEDDIHDLHRYAKDLGYVIEPIREETTTKNPIRFKISNPTTSKYGWISKTRKLINGIWSDQFVYGYYKGTTYHNAYDISFNVQSKVSRTKSIFNVLRSLTPSFEFRTVFGIIDLEGNDKSFIDAILCHVSTLNIQRV